MRITRNINGQVVYITLTDDERYAAYKEQQIQNYVDYIKESYDLSENDDVTLRSIAQDAIDKFWEFDRVGELEQLAVEEALDDFNVDYDIKDDTRTTG